MDGAITGYHTIAQNVGLVQSEVLGPVHDEFSQLLEGTGIEDEFDTLPGGEFSLSVLLFDAVFSAAEEGFLVLAFKFIELCLQGRILQLAFGHGNLCMYSLEI